MPDHRVISTSTLVKFPLSSAAFTKLSVGVYTRKMFTLGRYLWYLGKPCKSKLGLLSKLIIQLLMTIKPAHKILSLTHRKCRGKPNIWKLPSLLQKNIYVAVFNCIRIKSSYIDTIYLYNGKFDWSLIVDPIWLVWHISDISCISDGWNFYRAPGEYLATNLYKWTGDEFGTSDNLGEFRSVVKNAW